MLQSRHMSTGYEKGCIDVLRPFGKTISLISLYNKPEHPSVLAILVEIAEKLNPLFDKSPALVYVLMGDQVMVNGAIVGTMKDDPPNVAQLFLRHKIHSVTFHWGVTPDEIGVFAGALGARQGTGVKSPIEALVE